MQIDVAATPVVQVYQTLVGLSRSAPNRLGERVPETESSTWLRLVFLTCSGRTRGRCVFSPTLTRGGEKKDTLFNVEQTGEFVINSSSEKHAELINLSSKTLPRDESEIDLTGLATLHRCESARRDWLASHSHSNAK